MTSVSIRDAGWKSVAAESVEIEGYAVLLDVLDAGSTARVRAALYEAREKIEHEVGRDRLTRAGEIGTLRLLMKFNDVFFELIQIQPLLDIVDALIGDACILHTQNGFILPSYPPDAQPEVFQNTFHRDFPRYLNGFRASVSALIAIDDFNEDNGATRLVPGSHRLPERPSDAYLERCSLAAACPAGSVLLFDAALFHAAGKNRSGRDRAAVNQQFTRSYFKQQIDYVRALGDEKLESLDERTKQVLGWYTRVVTSLDEYYRPQEARLYRSGQG